MTAPSFEAWAMDWRAIESLADRIARAEESMAAGRLSAALAPRGSSMSIADGVATIDVRGPMLKKVPVWASWIGMECCSTQELAQCVRQASESPDVQRIVLRVDSPGGSIAGLQDLGDAVYQAREKKPVHALIEDQAASAAYWVAAQATEVVSTPGGSVGSIGVYLVSGDFSRMAENAGAKIRVHRTGDLKGIGVFGAPITEEQLSHLDEVVNEAGEDFVAAVARGRRMPVEKVKELATGRSWRASEARALNLVDRLETVPSATHRITGLVKERRMADENEIKLAVETALAQESARQESILAAFPEDQAFAFEQIKRKASLEQASVAYVPYLREKHKRELEAAAKARPTEVKQPAQGTAPLPAGGEGGSQVKDFMGQARDYAKEHKCSMTAAMSAVARANPDLHREWKAAQRTVRLTDPDTATATR